MQVGLRVLSFDAKRYLKQFDQAMKVQNKKAAGAWLATVVIRIPQRTGMAVASLLPLARFLAISHAGDVFDISPIKKPSATRNIPLGISKSDDPRSMFESTGTGEYLFRFDIKVWHWLINEFAIYGMGPYANPADPSIQPPWDSLEAGREAYLDYIRENVVAAIPRISEYIYRSKTDSGDFL